MAPETFDGEEIQGDSKVDIWSLGILLYEMFHFVTPFESASVFKMQKNIKSGKLKFKENINHKAKDLIELMLAQDHENRPTIVAVLHHSFFSENKTNCIKSEKKGFIENFKEGIK